MPSISPRLRPPPPPRAEYLPRPRLMARLNHGLNRRVTLVIAPAGYGKTTLLAHWAHQQRSPLAWATLDPEDAHLTNFLATLAAALSPFLPEMYTHLEELLFSASASPRDALHLLLAHLSRLPHPLVLLLDDVQHVDHASEVADALERLLRDAVPNLRLVLSARRFPHVPTLARLRAQGDAMVLTAVDLAFTEEETFRLLHDVFAIDVAPSQVVDVHRRTEGWPIALHLAARLIREHGLPAAGDIWAHVHGATLTLYDYLLHVVLAGQPPDLLAFLYRTSIVDTLIPDLCARLTGRQDALAVLGHLERSGLFTFPQNQERTRYRYHALFRDFLQRRLIEEVGEEGTRDLHRRAASFFLERGDHQQALGHLLAGHDYSTALELFRSLYRTLVDQGRHSLVEEWVACFPREWAENRPELVLARARLALVADRLDDARVLYERAEALFEGSGDRRALYHLYTDKARLHRRHGQFAAAAQALSRALTYADTPGQRAHCLASLAYCRYWVEGPTPEIFHLLERAHRLLTDEPDPATRVRVLISVGRIYGTMGDLLSATRAWHNALDVVDVTGHRYYLVGLLDNLAYYHYLLGDLDEAEELSERSLALGREFGQEWAYSLNIRAVLYAARGEFSTARDLHERALRMQQRQGDVWEIPVTMNWLGLLSRLEGRQEEALRWGREGLARRERLGKEYEIGLSLIDLGATHMARGEHDAAERLWRRALDIFTRYQARFEQAQLHFYLAYLAYTRGNDADVRHHLEQSMALAKTFEHDHPPRCVYFYILDNTWTAPLMAYALEQGVVPECAACLLPRLGKEGLAALISLLDAGEAQARAEAARLLAALGDTAALLPLHEHRHDPDPDVRRAVGDAIAALLRLPPEPLRVQLLGGFRLWRGEREITDWPRRSARDVFILLLHHAPHPVPGEVLIEAIWPHAPPRKGAQRLRRAISDLRHVLEPELPTGVPSRYVQAREGAYTLRLPDGSWVDVREFEKKAKEARALLNQGAPARARQALEEALSLYRGPYLPEMPYKDWALRRREDLRHRFCEVARSLARMARDAGAFDQAMSAAHRALAEDPYDEDAAAVLMEVLAARGRVPEALRVYETLRRHLLEDLGVSPRDDLVALYERLRSQ